MKTIMRWYKRLPFRVLAIVVVFLGAVEIGSRCIWSVRRGAPFLDSGNFIHAFYPELRNVDHSTLNNANDDGIDILMLGGSVLNFCCNSDGTKLEARLAEEFGRQVRIHNLANSAHSTMDSLYKYRHLEDTRFDIVVVYHGINETRSNNCPPHIFRPDYSHNPWYDTMRIVHNDGEPIRLVSAVTSRVALNKLAATIGLKHYIPFDHQPEEWLVYGAEVKSATVFERNVRSILELARTRRETVLLGSFAYCVDDPLGRPFDNKCRHYSWGQPELVARAIDTHNDLIVQLATAENALFVDHAALIPADGDHFEDMCHLRQAGRDRFVDNTVAALTASLDEQRWTMQNRQFTGKAAAKGGMGDGLIEDVPAVSSFVGTVRADTTLD